MPSNSNSKFRIYYGAPKRNQQNTFINCHPNCVISKTYSIASIKFVFSWFVSFICIFFVYIIFFSFKWLQHFFQFSLILIIPIIKSFLKGFLPPSPSIRPYIYKFSVINQTLANTNFFIVVVTIFRLGQPTKSSTKIHETNYLNRNVYCQSLYEFESRFKPIILWL